MTGRHRQRNDRNGRRRISAGEGKTGGTGMRQNQRRVVTGIAFLRNFNGSRRRRMAQHVGERRLLAADKQQREEQGKEGMQEAAHGASIRTHCPQRSIR